MELSENIVGLIRRHGPICFKEFMELCLYDPDSGYYTAKCNTIGNGGDFYTSATLTPVFGAIVGKQLEEMWALMGKKQFTIVEYGAGTGHLCRAIMTYLEANKEMFVDLRYCIIEKSLLMRNQIKKYLPWEVKWFNSITEIDNLNGCVLSNELIDNFSVHRVVMQKELMEVYVNYQNGFTEELRPARAELKDYLSKLNIKLSGGFCTEINLEALDWIKEVASSLNSGYVITIDYGELSPGLYKTSRSQGTLLCYYKHSVNDAFYTHIGEQDITSHVNFSALSYWGTKNGLRESGFTDQGYFLTALGFREQLLKSLADEQNIMLAVQKASLITQILLIDMGSKYKVLIQEKGVKHYPLSGLYNG